MFKAYLISDIEIFAGSADFFGLNFYTGGNVVDNPNKDNAWDPTAKPSFDDDKGTLGGRGEPSWTP